VNSKERTLFILALAGLTMSLVMTSLSAYIRLAESGIGCEVWPACQAEYIKVDNQPGITIASTDDNKGLRVIHRFMASAFGFVAMLLFILNLWYRKQLGIKPTLSAICFVLTMLLAMVGMITPDIFHPVVTFINLTAGMLTTAVLWLLVLRLNSLRVGNLGVIKPEGLQRNTSSSWIGLINVWLVIAVIASGAWVSANFASGACTNIFGCGLGNSDVLVDAFDLSREIQIADGVLVINDTQSTISATHQLLPMVLLVLLAFGSYKNYKAAPITSVLIIVIAVGLMFLGLVDSGMIAEGNPTLLRAWLHNFYSMLLLLVVIYNREIVK
jgi:cytochrome c oxidase assembly protein subunit 15